MFQHRRRIVIDHTQVPADLVNFPMLFYGTYPYLATVANGGNVKSASGFDIVFSSDPNGVVLLDFERVSWDAVTGAVEFWVRVPALSHSVDTVIYLCFSDPAIVADLQDRPGVWDSNYVAVFHIGTTVDPQDSTANANHMNWNIGVPQAPNVAGKIGNAKSFNGAQYCYRAGVVNNAPAATGPVTAQCWFKINVDGNMALFGIGEDVAGHRFCLVRWGGNVIAVEFCLVGAGNVLWAGDLGWHFYAASVPLGGNAADVKHVLDGAFPANVPDAGFMNRVNDQLAMATFPGALGANKFNGLLDELRLSKIVRSQNWLKTEFNNQNSPSTFYGLSLMEAQQVKGKRTRFF